MSGLSWGQAFTGTYDFASVTTGSGLTDPSTVPTATGVTFGSFVSNVGTNSSAAGRFSFTGWDTGATNGNDVTFSGAINTGKYYQVTITPAAGYTLDINTITFTSQRSGTGIRHYAVRSSVDTYGANLPASISPANAALSVVATNVFRIVQDSNTGANTGSTITLDASYDALSSATTFRFYGWDAEGSGGTFSIDNVVFTGVASSCPATVAGSITLFSSTCGSSTLTYGGADAAQCYWQTSSTGTTMGPGNIATSNYTTGTSGTYYVRNYNGTCWSSTYASSTITISNNPSLTSSPSNSSISETSNTSFSVTNTNSATYQWQVDYDGDGNFDATVVNGGVYTGATTATLTLTNVPLTMNGYKYKCIITALAPCAGFDISTVATLTVTPLYSSASDLLYVAGSSAVTISSTMNDAAPLTSSTGVQAMQFLLRDGGATTDSDTLPTTLTGFTIAQVSNTATDWSAAIKTIALFDGTTYVADGVVSASNIVFSGLNIVAADGGSKTLSLRMSLKCPLGSVVDGEYFGFSISNVTTTVLATGSHMTTFTAVKNAPATGGTLKIDVAATKLAFTTQPANTGVNTAMSNVVVKATDACGNVDKDFTGTVSLASSGTMTAVTPVAAVAGVVTFSNITHTATGTGLQLTATASGVTAGTSTTFEIGVVTVLQPGDIAILAFNTALASGDDEISFVAFVDITPGTRIDMTDNAYQKCGTPNGWGISEGWIRIERANTTLTKGTIVTVNVNNSGVASVVSPDPSNWVCSKPQPASQGTFNLNNTGEQIFFLSGGTVGGTNASTATSDGGTYSGNFLYGFNTKGNVWTPICGNSAAGGTQNSDKPTNFDCFLTWPTAQADLNKYTGPMTVATQRDWVSRISNSSNWTGYADNTAYNAGPNFYGASISISIGGYSNGVWIGDNNTNWFDCSNWQSRKVPDETVNVVVGTSAMQGVVIDATAASASSFNYLAKSKDLTVSNYNLKLEGSTSNILEVHGNVLINSTGAIDMDDSTSADDGIIKLYGDWNNSVSNAAFSEGNGTVQFVGTLPQTISSVAAEGTEVFYNVVLDNNFDTAVSNDLIASGDLTVKTGRTVSIDSNGFIKAYKKLDHSGTFTIEDNGQFIQVDDTDANVGTYNSTTFKVKRIANVNQNDYVYWSSPTNAFDQTNILSNGMRLIWNTTYANADTQGNWNWASTEIGYPAMTKGKGYAIAVPNTSPARPTAAAQQLTTFTGKPNNGSFTFPITKGTITADFTNAAGVPTTKYDDNWNLVGNPYPSAIDAEKFLQLNTAAIEGTVWIWKHGQAPTSTTNPFYQNFSYNYYTSDYCKYNKLGASDTDFAGKIASGQGFMVNMLESFVGSNTTITFNNSLRSDAASVTNPYAPYDNTDFYRTANNNTDNLGVVEEKSRIWMDIFNNTSNETDTTLLGYSTNSTLEKDHFYDAIFVPRGSVSFYSLINDETFIIQGRPLPFDKEDKVPMGVNITTAGNHTIAIKKTDGIFAEDTPIYLEDKLLNIIHDLKQAPYVFNSPKGTFNNRFVVRYTNESLGNDDFDAIDHNVVVSTRNGELTINSYIENLAEVTVYDILGRQLLEAKNIANNVFVTSNISASQQALLVKIKLANGTVVTRKIIL
ncbi:T9SS sorting signal type C domain-containing protein [Flavobacterium phycosphaerae]|uniref:T9SS sorting signal type C domain-containing protein n=1 Tax=Flavobacterium phycosphaerae TaxID=2697515 RepID=UPI001389B28C|nr:T9SS sorting signal type C domain-containing protein [Flavobacterium phycosphaerae]